MEDLIIIDNKGAELANTNYWDHPMARQGFVYLTWNAGAARLLVPDTLVPMIPDWTRGVSLVVLSTGLLDDDPARPAIELMFEDGSDAPFALHFLTSQSDRDTLTVSTADAKKARPFALWTRAGCVWRSTIRVRAAGSLPCMAPWQEPA